MSNNPQDDNFYLAVIPAQAGILNDSVIIIFMSNLVSDILIELHVPDFEATKKFYGELGFGVVWEKKPEERKGYMVMRNGTSILNFYCGNEHVYEQTYFRKYPKETKRGYAVEVVIPSGNIKKLYAKVEKKYKNLIVAPLEKRFDKLDFRMVDPFGFYLRFVERYDWVNGRDKNGNTIE
jgi:catechol 2,3-dioxygenase-like lactoylglutathione lyase family enzyme